MLEDCVEAVSRELPDFNDYLLKDYRREQVEKFPEFLHGVFQEAVKLFHGALIYRGYRVLPPEKHVAYSTGNGMTRGRINIQQSHLSLLEFMFEYDGQLIPVHLYMPYLHNGFIVINDTKYYLQLAIIERMIYRVTDGVIIKVMRSPLQFWRTEQYTYKSVAGQTFCDAVITAKIHYKKKRSGRDSMKTPLILYLLARFDFDHVYQKILGLSPGSVAFTPVVGEEKNVTYFKCKNGLYLRVVNEVLEDISSRRFVASLLYILGMTARCGISEVYDKTLYKTILGKNLYGSGTKEALAAGHAESHLSSLESYLDPFTKNELGLMRIYCDDIFDLLVAVFFNIDSWLVNYSPNDLFEKRIGGADAILMSIVKFIFTRFYETLKKQKCLTVKSIKSMLKCDPMKIKDIYLSPCLRSASSCYGDNYAISCAVKRMRQTSQEQPRQKKSMVNISTDRSHQFHPSFAAIESITAISTSSPGISGEINPFAVIDKNGCFVKSEMPWYEEIRPLNRYISQS